VVNFVCAQPMWGMGPSMQSSSKRFVHILMA
jgi:hypothetical protein